MDHSTTLAAARQFLEGGSRGCPVPLRVLVAGLVAELGAERAGAAALRQAYLAAVSACWRDGSPVASLPKDHPAIEIWGKLYAATRDNTAGAAVLNDLDRLRAELAEKDKALLALGERCHGQSEALAARAAKTGDVGDG